jgi:L-ascorbate metabolism protein UlaG (beta-lactamase superfamily)
MTIVWGVASWFTLALAAFAQPAHLDARFIGNMAFAITDGTTTLYTDYPYEPGAFDYMTYDFSKEPRPSDCLCLITHGHRDHFDAALFRQTHCRIVAPPSLTASLPSDRILAFGKEIAYRDIRIEPARTPHGDIEHDSYLVTWRGLHLYFTGDTDRFDDLVSRRNLDAAFVSPWLLTAIASHGERIDAKLVIVYHQRAGEQVPSVLGRMVPKQGETIQIEARP